MSENAIGIELKRGRQQTVQANRRQRICLALGVEIDLDPALVACLSEQEQKEAVERAKQDVECAVRRGLLDWDGGVDIKIDGIFLGGREGGKERK